MSHAATILTSTEDAKARTQEALDKAIARAIELITPADAEAWFRNCGFEVGFA